MILEEIDYFGKRRDTQFVSKYKVIEFGTIISRFANFNYL